MEGNLLAYFFLLLEVLEQSSRIKESPEFMMAISVENSAMDSPDLSRDHLIMLCRKMLPHEHCSLVFIEIERENY